MQGLEAISRHAKGLGYDAVVLFLDELVLWLASRMSDVAFVSREGAKVVKLVEADAAQRPAPIVSFIARQRDLRELVGDHVPGAQSLTRDRHPAALRGPLRHDHARRTATCRRSPSSGCCGLAPSRPASSSTTRSRRCAASSTSAASATCC